MKAKAHSSKPPVAHASRRGLRAPQARQGSGAAASISPEQRHAMIAEAAYYRAQRRGFAAGRELQDWLAAEADIDRTLGEPTLLEHQLAHSDT